jgi:hypothetical protein
MRDCRVFRDDSSLLMLYGKLSDFKFIYILYFFANILSMLANLSRVFQYKFFEVSSMGQIVKTEIALIDMCFLLDNCDLNRDTFNEFSGYHIIPEFEPPIGYL